MLKVNDRKEKNGIPYITLILIGLMIILWFLVAFLAHVYANYFGASTDGIAGAGQVGDSFGAVNALFTGLGCVGIFHVLFVEQREREAQRKRDFTLRIHEQFMTEEYTRKLMCVLRSSDPDKTVGWTHTIASTNIISLHNSIARLVKIGLIDVELASSLLGESFVRLDETLAILLNSLHGSENQEGLTTLRQLKETNKEAIESLK